MPNTKQKKKTKNNVSNVKKTYTDPVTGKFVKGNPGGGRVKGSKNFDTYIWEAAEKIAKDQTQKTGKKVKAEEIMGSLYITAIAQAKSGNYSFYSDIMDRTHGRPVISAEIEHSNKFEGYTKEQLVEFILDKIGSVK